MSRSVLMLNENRGRGGGEVQTLRLSLLLRERGHRVRLGVRRDAWLAEKGAEAGLPVDLYPLSSEIDPISLAALITRVHRDRIQVIHCHAHRDMVLAALARPAFPRTRVVKSEHTFPGPHLSGLGRYAYRRRLDRVLCVSRAVQGELLAALDVRPERAPVLHNGLDLERLQGPGEPLPGLPPRRWIAAVASLLPSKGQQTLLRAMPRILEEIPEAGLLLAGEGPERERLERLAGELGLGPRILFCGHLEDPGAAFRAAEIVVVPSLVETFSLAALEAMAWGRPVVASRVGGLPEVVEDGQTGALVASGDPEALAGALLTYLRTPELARAHGLAGRARARERFSAARQAEHVEAIYSELLQ